MYRELEPRHPVQEIPAGNCTLLLRVLGVFILSVVIIRHRIHPISNFFCPILPLTTILTGPKLVNVIPNWPICNSIGSPVSANIKILFLLPCYLAGYVRVFYVRVREVVKLIPELPYMDKKNIRQTWDH